MTRLTTHIYGTHAHDEEAAPSPLLGRVDTAPGTPTLLGDYLRYFSAAGRHDQFGKAARALGISQPALSCNISKLETELGEHLFNRVGRE